MLLGCDFSSAPTARKPITLAVGERRGSDVHVNDLCRFSTLDAWQEWLQREPAWVGAFDLPFGLPRALWEAWGWQGDWQAGMARYADLSRDELRQRFKTFCAARPVGQKMAHRATDLPAGASPSMKWVNPPVAWMMHAGVPRLLATGAYFPGLGGEVDSLRVALEGYPALLARELIGRQSYKADATARQTSARAQARAELLQRLQQSGSARLGLRLVLTTQQAAELQADAKADALDAVLCLMQAAWAVSQPSAVGEGPGYGLPAMLDPLEGWILSA